MIDREKPLTLALYNGPNHHLWAVLHGTFVVLFGLIALGFGAGNEAMGAYFGLFGFVMIAAGLIWIFVNLRKAGRDRPVFEADRHGFRIRGGRNRPWGTFGGTVVVERRSKGVVMGETLYIRVNSIPILGRRRVAYDHNSVDVGQMVKRIRAFQSRLDDVLQQEQEQWIGPAPVVAARERMARQAQPKVAVLDRLKQLAQRVFGFVLRS